MVGGLITWTVSVETRMWFCCYGSSVYIVEPFAFGSMVVCMKFEITEIIQTDGVEPYAICSASF